MRRILSVLLLSLTIFTIYARIHSDHDIKCTHHENSHIKPEQMRVQELNFTDINGGRTLATTTYPQLRMTTDFTYLTNGTTAWKNYIKNELIPPIQAFFQSALKIKYPLTSNLKWTSATICSLNTISALKTTGLPTDFYILFVAESDPDGSWVASSYACLTSTVSKRPLIAKTTFNIDLMPLPDGDPLVHERNTYLAMHEVIHTLGFSYSLFDNFLTETGTVRTGHIKTSSDGAVILDVPPLTDKLRAHFNCSTIQGAQMESDGSVTGSQGSHFERRFFNYETMTSGVLHGRRLSEFTLALLEGSGWYIPDYSYAEPFYFGKDEGCNFLTKTCGTTGFNPSEFCTGTARGCTPVGRGGGKCTADAKSDGCKFYYPTLEYDCENPDAVDNARFTTREAYGRDIGSRCFTGNLSTLTSSTFTSFCFKYTCSGTGTSTKLVVNTGTVNVTCTKEAAVKVSGLNGLLNCPDPQTFCTTVGLQYCPRGCMGRGTCTNNKCVCKAGYTGKDCALSTSISY